MADERKKNSFQRLMEDEYESRFTLPQMMEVEQRLQRKQNSYRVAGDMIDLFFPKIIRTVGGMLGGDDNEHNRPMPSEHGGVVEFKKPKAPGER